MNEPEYKCYFGNCPICGHTNGYRNLGREHWGVCHTHKTKWCLGINVHSSWQYEDDFTWITNVALLSQYQDVESVGEDCLWLTPSSARSGRSSIDTDIASAPVAPFMPA